jgi:hypothetical protein
MANILIERFTNLHGTSWVRAHGIGFECFALCSSAIHPDVDGVEEGIGHITCQDCIAVIQACKDIPDTDLAPEYDNELFHRRFGKHR